jgi:hypothetical protein
MIDYHIFILILLLCASAYEFVYQCGIIITCTTDANINSDDCNIIFVLCTQNINGANLTRILQLSNQLVITTGDI